MIYSKKFGFTLIELLITVSIIAVLSGLVMINIYGNLAKARDAKRKNDLREIRTSLDIYYNIKNMYPPSVSSWPPPSDLSDGSNGLIKGCNQLTDPQPCLWGSPWTQDGTTFMGSLPRDPKSTQNYFYMRDPSGRLSYILMANLERSFDPDIATSQALCFVSGFSFSPGWYVVCDVK